MAFFRNLEIFGRLGLSFNTIHGKLKIKNTDCDAVASADDIDLRANWKASPVPKPFTQ